MLVRSRLALAFGCVALERQPAGAGRVSFDEHVNAVERLLHGRVGRDAEGFLAQRLTEVAAGG